MNDNHHEKAKICRFSGEPCIGDECEQWIEIAVGKPGMIAPQKEGMCIFKALLLVSSSPKMMMAPPQNLGLGNLKI